MKNPDVVASKNVYELQHLFSPPSDIKVERVIQSSNFERNRWSLPDQSSYLLDKFPNIPGVTCCFVRLAPDQGITSRFIVRGGHELITCPAGGWLLKANNEKVSSYWIPQLPVYRTEDSYGRILSEETAPIIGFRTSSETLEVEIKALKNKNLDVPIWRIEPDSSDILEELERTLVLEKQSVFFWTSETAYQMPADVYLYCVHGLVYTNRFIWPRNWKICSELDAYGLYVTLNGLECATGKKIYNILKRQLVFSVISRQAEDGAWYHGEWTKYMESHYRFLNGAMLLMEASLGECPDEAVTTALRKAAHFLSTKTDNTDLGLWFLHDSLEDTREMMEEMCRVNGSNWIQKPVIGKSATNKLILNTHVDTIISMDYYRRVSGDEQYSQMVRSAVDATRGVLALRPAEFLYRLIYRAINLTILPEEKAKQLPIVPRAIKRLTWKYLTPNLYRIKNIFPRLVMPGGFIERHLGMGHYDISYHPINILDLTRLWRCFPDEDLRQILENAVKAVDNCDIMEFWAEKEPRHKSLVEMVDALYHLCTLEPDIFYRQVLVRGILIIEDWNIGLPPSLLGGDPEAVSFSRRIPTPSPSDSRLRIANLSHGNNIEIIVVNPTAKELQLDWETNKIEALSWFDSDNCQITNVDSALSVPSRGWIWGKRMSRGNHPQN